VLAARNARKAAEAAARTNLTPKQKEEWNMLQEQLGTTKKKVGDWFGGVQQAMTFKHDALLLDSFQSGKSSSTN